MAIIILLNIVFAVLVVGGILALLSWGIAADRASVATLGRRQRTVRTHRRGAQSFSPALHPGA